MLTPNRSRGMWVLRGIEGYGRTMALFSRKKTEPDTTIDLREPAPAPAPTPPPQWGSPVPCPSCEGRGYLDHIDPFKEIMYLHCIECFSKYEVSKADIDSLRV